jgi:hypothetical protein
LGATGLPVYEAGSVILNRKMPKNLGRLLLAVWLILFGVLTAPLLKFRFAHSGDVLTVLGIAAGVLLLLQRLAGCSFRVLHANSKRAKLK